MDAAVCFYCGARRPGLWGFGPLVGRLIGRLDFARAVTIVCVVAYVASILLDPGPPSQARSPFDLLSPAIRALVTLGMTGAAAVARRAGGGRSSPRSTSTAACSTSSSTCCGSASSRPRWSSSSARARLVVIFTAGGVAGFVALQPASAARFTVGASGAVFGLLGAMVAYGRSRGGIFGVAVFRQYGQWAVLMFIFGFFMPGVNNWGHAGGFVGGYLAALALGHGERRSERGLDRWPRSPRWA